MNVLFDKEVTVITPCFCSGADQNIAEIRASAIRGEWRWWFRVLGGTATDEADLFGSTSGDGKASKVIVRVSMQERGEALSINLGSPMSPLAYLLYFANVSSSPKGARLSGKGMVPPGSTFKLQVLERMDISENFRTMVIESLRAMLRFGAVGYRARRACGALSSEIISFTDFKQHCSDIAKDGVEVVWLTKNDEPLYYKNDKAEIILGEMGQILKDLRKDGYSAGKSGDTLTPFGNAGNKRYNLDRQASGVRLRPVKLKEGILPVLVYVETGLDPQCRDSSFYLRGKYVGSGVLAGA